MSSVQTQRPPSWRTVLLLVAALGFMAGITLLPIGWQLNRFVVWVYYEGLRIHAWPGGGWITLATVAHVLNVVLTIPIGWLARLAVPRVGWWVVPAAILVISTGIETAQWMLPLGREGMVADVITNTLGGVIGALLGQWWITRSLRSQT